MSDFRRTHSPLVKLTHWFIATAIVMNLFIVNDGEDLHVWAGYLAMAALFFRLFSGFANKKHSVKNHISKSKLARGTHFLIWLSLISLGVSGFMMGLDKFWGEDWVEDWHYYSSQCIQYLALAHLAGLALDSFKMKRITPLGMWK